MRHTTWDGIVTLCGIHPAVNTPDAVGRCADCERVYQEWLRTVYVNLPPL